eukprot:TRINITY_DN22028_c1_g1_i3.p1 TRINITY_DN22028_c1_g1~~TRINITY_DN22028_c1_g1_i3.p1  ORF type:complete len:483 (+),score=129.17 TRINITY_DN22028_c1_g1_i3:82-1449(+)
MGRPTYKPRMWLAEGAEVVVRLSGSSQELIWDLQRAAAAQADQRRRAELALSHTRGRLAAVTRKLSEREAEADRANRARGRLARDLELSRQELAKITAALREKEAVNEGLLWRLGEKEAAAERAECARSQAVESLQQELAAVCSALRDKDMAIELLRADQLGLLRQAQDETAHVRAQLIAACREACVTAQRARELEQRISDLETPAVTAGGSPEHSHVLPSRPAGSPESGTPQALVEAAIGCPQPIRSPRTAQPYAGSGEASAGRTPGSGALLAHLQQFLDSVPIGGNPASTSERQYNVEPLLQFAEARGLDTSTPAEAIYRLYVDCKAAAASPKGAESATALGGLRTPSPRGVMRRRLGAPLQRSHSRASDASWTEASCSLPPSPAAAAAAPAGGARWFSAIPAVGRQLAAAAAGAAAAALPGQQLRGGTDTAGPSGGRAQNGKGGGEEDAVLA